MIPYNYANEYLWQKCSVDSVRPAAGYGATITAAANTKGSYAAVLSSADIAYDVYFLSINFNSGAVSTGAKDTIIDIGVDPAGGTNYSVLIPDLLASCSCTLGQGAGINYYFPIFIKAGSSIAARASVNNAGAPGTVRCIITVYGKPANPALARAGTSVVAYGVNAALSRGVLSTINGSTWNTLATSITESPWYWQLGMGVNDSTMTASNIYWAKLAYGDATNKNIIIEAVQWEMPTAAEILSCRGTKFGCAKYVKAGNNIYVQAVSSGTADTNISFIAYGVVGG